MSVKHNQHIFSRDDQRWDPRSSLSVRDDGVMMALATDGHVQLIDSRTVQRQDVPSQGRHHKAAVRLWPYLVLCRRGSDGQC